MPRRMRKAGEYCDVGPDYSPQRRQALKDAEHVEPNRDVAGRVITQRVRQLSGESETERLWNEWLARVWDEVMDR